jgi:uncharacterized membrane protein YoaK (UPF0700 family)
MDRHPHFAWVLWGGFLLAMNAGFVNALGILTLLHQTVSHLTGTISNFGIAAAQGNGDAVRETGYLVLFFLLGAMLSGVIVGNSQLRFGRRYGVSLMLQSLLLVAATYYLQDGLRRAEYLLALACGLQNGMATTYSGAVVRTTHMTGIVTDLGVMLGLFVRYRQPLVWWRVWVWLSLVVGFALGGGISVVVFGYLGIYALLVAATAVGLSGIGYFAYYQWLHWHNPTALA